MPRIVPIEFFPIARTAVDRRAVRAWLDHLGASDFDIPPPDAATDPALLVALAAKRCYMSFQPGLNPNVTRVRADLADYLGNVLAQGHGSVLEHAVYTFAIEGVSRVFTAEMNRHRAGWGISEGSLRFIRFGREIPFWLPTSLQADPRDPPELAERKRVTAQIMYSAFVAQEDAYRELERVWDVDEGSRLFAYKKRVTSLFRRIVGMGVATGGVWTGNIRAIRHVISMRADPAAEEEIFHVFSRIARFMVEEERMLFCDFEAGDDGSWRPRHWKV